MITYDYGLLAQSRAIKAPEKGGWSKPLHSKLFDGAVPGKGNPVGKK